MGDSCVPLVYLIGTPVDPLSIFRRRVPCRMKENYHQVIGVWNATRTPLWLLVDFISRFAFAASETRAVKCRGGQNAELLDECFCKERRRLEADAYSHITPLLNCSSVSSCRLVILQTLALRKAAIATNIALLLRRITEVTW